MLPSNKRLDRNLFRSLSESRILSTTFNRIGTLKYLKTLDNYRFSVVVSSKKEKSAVKRNKIKRRIYSLVRDYYKNNQNFVHAILFLSKDAYSMDFIDLNKHIYELLDKTK